MTEKKKYKVKKRPVKQPLLLYDGDCHFCRYWVARWRRRTNDRVEYAPQQGRSVDFPEIPLKALEAEVHFITPSGEVFSGAEAVFNALNTSDRFVLSHWLYYRVPLFRIVSEWIYGLIAGHRPIFSWLTRWIWGTELYDGGYFLSRWLFLRFLGIIFLIAFGSLWAQLTGLVGEDGIIPAAPFLEAVAKQYGPERYYLLPTIFWLDAGNNTLNLVCAAGVLFSFLLILGFCVPLVTALLWFLYLSIFSVGRTFLGFQWDILLLEVGFLSIFLGSLQIRSNLARESQPSALVLFLFRLLLFKLMLSSGLVKLLSGDPVWANLTALDFHYQTQPIPPWTAWYIHQLPAWAHKFSTAVMFIIELVVPFFIFSPRRLRYAAGFSFIGLQALIIGSGNYCFFNLLSIALCLFLFDDSFWPKSIRQKVEHKRSWRTEFLAGAWSKYILWPMACLILLMNLIVWPPRIGIPLTMPSLFQAMAQKLYSFHFVGTYGLFAVMTTRRAEIIVEGSYDGEKWLEYDFKYKPGDLKRRPPFVAPHQPRLDWQMWFAALGTARQNPWFVNFCVRLLQNSPSVLKLIEKNPFQERPPRYIRAMMYDYEFTNFKERKETGQWWKISNPRVYLSPVSLQRKRS